MAVFVSQGEPGRSMALLWRDRAPTPPRPGPRPVLSVDAIVDAAVAVADRDGLAGLSMRAVGARLGRTAMSLYTHVPGKSELLDLMYDRALGEMPATYPQAGWREAVTAWAGDLWDLYLRHPWMLQVSHARPVLGPGEYAMLETVAGIMVRTGLPGRTLWRMVGALLHLVGGVAGTVADARAAAAATGVCDDEWWQARSAALEQVAPDFAERFPTLQLLAARDAFGVQDDSVPYLEQEARETFAAGLAVLLDGAQAAVDRNGGPDHPPPG